MNRERSPGTDTPQPDSLEHAASGRPRIYVASLADYNAGRLHGRWLDADRDVEDLHADVQALLATSPEPGAEEAAIHDYEGFGHYQLAETEPLVNVSVLARQIGRYGLAFSAYAALVGADEVVERPDDFQDNFLGDWPSLHDFAAAFADDCGWEQELARLPSHLQAYIRLDVDALGHDLSIDLNVVQHQDGVWVFSP